MKRYHPLGGRGVGRVKNYLSQRHTWRFYTPIAANLMASENRKRFSPPIDADTPGDFFRRSRRCGSFENSCDKIAQPDGFALLAIRSNERRKSRERAHLANAGEFNPRYLTWQISAILYADRGDRRKSQSLHRAHLSWSLTMPRSTKQLHCDKGAVIQDLGGYFFGLSRYLF